MMKNWQRILVVFAFLIMGIMPLQAQPLQTFMGNMTVPPTFSVINFDDSLQKQLFLKNHSSEEVKKILGEYIRFYQLVGEDQGSIKTAHLFMVKIDTQGKDRWDYLDMVKNPDSPSVKILLEGTNQTFLNLDKVLNAIIEKKTRQKDIRITIKDQELIAPIKSGAEPIYRAAARVYVDATGFELLYYVQAYVQIKENSVIGAFLLTSDAERRFFAQPVQDMIAHVE